MNQNLNAAQQALIDQAREQEAIWRAKFLEATRIALEAEEKAQEWRERARSGGKEPGDGARRPCSGKPWPRKEVRAAGKVALAFGL